jgi:hypothetical protein
VMHKRNVLFLTSVLIKVLHKEYNIVFVDFERAVNQEYKNEVRKKEQEIQQLQKNLLRDSMRIAFNELGKIHY